jgi:hypothetical protein
MEIYFGSLLVVALADAVFLMVEVFTSNDLYRLMQTTFFVQSVIFVIILLLFASLVIALGASTNWRYKKHSQVMAYNAQRLAVVSWQTASKPDKNKLELQRAAAYEEARRALSWGANYLSVNDRITPLRVLGVAMSWPLALSLASALITGIITIQQYVELQ